ncbi:stage II sporulation protein M [Paenibacillus sp.]|uniref:stage II sporulation protein M n=1 Tax=Paenibacillus sp. TaxID=58172 RepID=UPI002D2EEDFE|nr:stage II sporulation protein M [Paenibacillus sp.]HZG55571.1 stage II sporulation protein M [Paenibacillus sp.]
MNANNARAFAKDLATMKWYIAVCVALFAASAAFGASSGWLDAYLAKQIEPLRGLVERLEAMDNSQVWFFLFIFVNNFLKSLLAVFLGALFGLFPLYFVISNGLIIGYVVSSAGAAGADVGSLIVRGLLPHGLLEVTAILIAASYGLKYGLLILAELVYAFRGRGSASALKAFHGTLGRLVVFLFFALLLAAFIESTITYMLVRG